MKQFYTTILMAVISLACFADGIEGLSPVLNNSYYLYNVATGMYLTATPDGSAQLSATGTEFALSLAENGAYKLTSTSGDLSTSFIDQTILAGNGQYDGWKVRTLDGQNNVYALACMQDETKAYAYLIYNNTISGLKSQATMPSIAEGQWMLVHKGEEVVDPDESVLVDEIILNNKDYTYSIPENMAEYVTVKVYRKAMAKSTMNGICLPFDIPHSEVLRVFGKTTFIYEYNKSVGSSVYYKHSTGMKAGVPYVIKPSEQHEGDFYEFKNISSSSFVDEPSEIAHGDFVFRSSFVKLEPAPTDFYIYNSGKFTHYNSATSLTAFVTYVQPLVAGAKISGQFFEDETTGISEIVEFEKYDIYNISGQLVKKNAQTFEDLTPGIYVVNGKKFIVK